jgi:hypothetical protein
MHRLSAAPVMICGLSSLRPPFPSNQSLAIRAKISISMSTLRGYRKMGWDLNISLTRFGAKGSGHHRTYDLERALSTDTRRGGAIVTRLAYPTVRAWQIT